MGRHSSYAFLDRADAGRRLAQALERWRGAPGLLVLGLPRGGVPVAQEVARLLGAPLDVLLVRKLGVPGHEELAMGAIGQGGVLVRNEQVLAGLGLPDATVAAAAAREGAELERRLRAYRGGRGPGPGFEGRTVVLVDDGLATGATMRAAVQAVRAGQAPAAVIVAVPVGSAAACRALADPAAGLADEVVCLCTPEEFEAVGAWYADFHQVDDEEVRAALAPGDPLPDLPRDPL